MVSAVLAGQPAKLDLDLGSDSPLILWNSFWRRLGLTGPRSTTVIGGVGGFGEAGITVLPEIELGGATFSKVPTILMPEGARGVARERSDGNIGVGLLGRFRLIIDLPHDRVWFAGAPDETTSFAKDRAGLFALRDAGRLRIVHVASGSPAAAAGLHKGDEITHVDGVAIADLPAKQWADDPPGVRHRLRLVNGKLVTLTLADYF